ncbi:PKD domain-containing protein, partial [Bacteroides sp.]|uniref:PKD domain-containing protein n=1 Tax=Bacteroides sp. TaxID=29523 RepID=UPI00261BA910
TKQNDTFTYNNKGIYTVNLTVKNEIGTVNTTTDTIKVYGTPVVDFSASSIAGETPLTVDFTDESENAVEWSWDFNGDGVEDSTKQNDSFTYETPKTYTVTLTVKNEGGTQKTATKTITVYGIPVADFTPSTTEGDAPLNVQFTDKSKYAISWAWDFDGDGNVDSTKQNDTFTYNNKGIYTVNLTVKNEIGTVNTTTDTIKVYGTPVADFSASPIAGETPLTVDFTDKSENAVEWSWDFNGDGVEDSTKKNDSFTYETPENYTVTLIVKNEGGTSNSKTKENFIIVAKYLPPIAEFTANTSYGIGPLVVEFTNMSFKANSLYWDFGDGHNSTEEKPTNTYSVPKGKYAKYPVSLTINKGTINETTKTTENCILVVNETALEHDSCNVSLEAAPFKFTSKEGINYTVDSFTDLGALIASKIPANISDAGYSNTGVFSLESLGEIENEAFTENHAYSWWIYINDEQAENGLGENDLINGDNVSFIYAPYEDGEAQTDLAAYIHNITVHAVPEAKFSVNVSKGVAPLTVNFTDLSENATALLWEFEDGKNSTDKN